MLKIDDYRRLFDLLEEIEPATTLSALRRSTLDACASHLGWEHAIFLTGLKDTGKVEGVALGFPQRRLDALCSRLSRAQAMARLLGSSVELAEPMTEAEIWPLLTESGRAIGSEHLGGNGLHHLLGLWLDAPGPTKGLLVLLTGSRAPTVADRERLALLGPHVTNLLALQAPRESAAGSTSLLTPREAETVELVAAGFSNRTIARRLNVTESTVKKHVSASLTKLDVDSRTQLALTWLRTEARNGSKKRPRAAAAQ